MPVLHRGVRFLSYRIKGGTFTLITIKIDGEDIQCKSSMTILEVARESGIYIPTLCSHPDLNPTGTCRLCIVEIEGMKGFPTSCSTPVSDGMRVVTNSNELSELRRDILSLLLERHPHACLNCAQREGCTREPCSTNVPVNERCCPLFGNCEFQRIVEYVGMREDTPKYVPKKTEKSEEEPLFTRERSLCILCGRCVEACNNMRGVGVLGFIERGYETYVGTAYGRTYPDSDCRFCGACVQVCPTGALRDRDLAGGVWAELLVPCKHTCPAGIDVPRFVRLILNGEYSSAAAVIRESNPLSNLLGHICFSPCENECRRGKINDAISIRDLQKFAASRDDGLWRKRLSVSHGTGKRIAIVGSGPSGLSAAYYLAIKGHDVTVFEQNLEAGGALRKFIPEYRLPTEVLAQEILLIKELGVDIHTGTKIDSIDYLKNEGYDAVYLAVGAWKEKPINIPGIKKVKVIMSLKYLGDASIRSEIGNRVVVVGRGHALIESARVALRRGAEELIVITDLSSKNMELYSEEIMLAEEEGMEINFDCHIKGISDTDDDITIQIESPQRGMVIKADTLITAGDTLPSIPDEFNIVMTPNDRIKANRDTLATSILGVYAGGDAVSMGKGAVEAVEAGKRAARNIDLFLGGDGNLKIELSERVKPNDNIGKIKRFAELEREMAERSSPEKRLMENGADICVYDENRAHREASRCLCCDLRLNIAEVPRPPEKWLVLNEENVSTVPASEGVYQLYDDEKNVIVIKGTWNIREDLSDKLNSDSRAQYFVYEEDKMYSKRENELLQVFMQTHGRMPEGDGGDDDLDDLF
ncbi:MAG: FAD-dependent oxidoreductase [Candidatus Thermoplasmatota archaeon]|jgi:NADPH-dependent glutamate synthase beta subunit-like oxidoreductase/ferredoxin|nr:FAD-dependent oxidoreductase [Candidatus Thermoplasmatota archaeon]MDP7264678.1 FAD-dependent oxidoreductase [Candidatus Thermoplasmatota archaeon]